MSNTAIKDVTRALQGLLLSQLKTISSSAQVSLVPPGDKLPTGLGVNLYLFRVAECPFTRNRDWPGDRATPPSGFPALSLELSYLLTPYSPAPDSTASVGDDAHTMLGAAMLVLHENPVLNKVHIPGFDADSALPANVLNSYEQVKVTLAATSIDELSKIWSTINQPYRLSVAYHVSLIQLTPTPPPVNGAAVRNLNLGVAAWNAPRLESLTPSRGALARIDGAGALVLNTLTINGSSLLLPEVAPVVKIADAEAAVSQIPAPTATGLTVVLPGTVAGGPQVAVSVSLSGRIGASIPFIVTPWLSSITPIRTTLESTALTLTGIGFTTSPKAVRFEGSTSTATVSSFNGPVTDTQAAVSIPATLSNGLYTVRIVLNDVSGSASNGVMLEVIPAVASPIGVTTVTVNGAQVHRLTIDGARLSGADVRLLIDDAIYSAGANANANQIVFTLGRLLLAGRHSVAVSVDGSVSHRIELVIP